MKVVFLGTNGWYDSPTGNTICILIESEMATILLDAGSGLYKADRYIEHDKPVYLFLSHLHLDHIIGLHLLNKFDFKKGLTIFCRKGDKTHLQTIVDHPYTLPLSQLPYPVEIVELEEGVTELDGFNVQTALLRHSVPTIGFRITTEGKSIAYCPDTGYCDNAVKLGRSVDLLIAECAFRSGEESNSWPHLNPEKAAKLAQESKAKRLALVHFDAYRYPDMGSRIIAYEKARNIYVDTLLAEDDQVIFFN
jgi:ribonuclease BN (tRNA processing enzyme)